jgi:glutaredoxin
MNYELVMYSRKSPCPWVTIAKRVLEARGIPYRELLIDQDEAARQTVLALTGFLSVPTLVITKAGEIQPYTDPAPLPPGASPRGIDRGSIITEASENELVRWLDRHGFLTPATR